MLKVLVFIVATAVAALLLFTANKPDSFQVERALLVKSNPEDVFALINDFHQWEAWSPWAKKDPTMKVSYSGANSGLGAVYEWSGNNEVGQGRMEIIDMSPPSHIKIRLDFIAPFEAHNVAEFSLEPSDDHTQVSWTTYGPMSFVSKLFSVFVSMDDMIGTDFEAGLANLKGIAEK